MNNLIPYFEHIPDFIFNLLLLFLAIIAGLVIRFILNKSFWIYYRRSKSFTSQQIIRHLHTPVGFLLPLMMVNATLPLMRMSKDALAVVDKTVEIGLVLAFAAVIIYSIKILELVVFHIYDISQSNNLKARRIRTQMQFIRQLLVSIIVVLTLAAILMSFENMRKLGAGLLGGVAIGATILGFAAQQSLGNLLAGFQIAFTQPIRIDDVLVVEGEWGRVEEITLTYVVLRIWDQRRLILPISYFIQKPFQNWTRNSSDILGTAFFYLDYRVPVEKVREELTRLLQLSPLWDGKVDVLQVTDTKERSVEIRALMSARNSGEAFDLRCYIRENLIKFIENNYPESLPRTRAEIDQAVVVTDCR
ncbi:mechanosensitive ion channel-like protein [Arcticibacter pallidicorallinus]|uniref:Mechanosensitive ion channel-like protein n=1 Tax=Arcticibacter pallidicorallinus TaxID=1259464 RepID=A0A2T0UC93_9SPHI|nr:mechanosensitive ion channel domain-containing protein [Arcticibacter pallidicorallinus]PRY55543.1 mechanosensitive ion channel-like protein [Arcticibacter pallidicorallinus]